MDLDKNGKNHNRQHANLKFTNSDMSGLNNKLPKFSNINNKNTRKKLVLPKILINDTNKLDPCISQGVRFDSKKHPFLNTQNDPCTLNKAINNNSKQRKNRGSSLSSSSNSETSAGSLTLVDNFTKKIYFGNLSRLKGSSQYFNDDSIESSSLLALPSPVYKKSRSKSEKIKSKSIKIFDKERELGFVLIDSDKKNLFKDTKSKSDGGQSYIDNSNLSSNNVKPVVIKKSEPCNVDIIGSNLILNEYGKEVSNDEKVEKTNRILSNEKNEGYEDNEDMIVS